MDSQRPGSEESEPESTFFEQRQSSHCCALNGAGSLRFVVHPREVVTNGNGEKHLEDSDAVDSWIGMGVQ